MYQRRENLTRILVLFWAFMLISSAIWASYLPHSAKAEVPTSNSARSQSISPSIASNFTVYKSSVLGIELEYPSNWTVLENLTHGKVEFDSPAPSYLTRGGTAAHIRLFLPPYLNPSLSGVVNSTISNLRDSLLNFQVIESNATTVSGNPAHKLVFSWISPLSGPTKSLGVYTVVHGIAYSLGFGSTPDQYDANLPILQKMIQSFKIINPPTAPSGR